jgi:hypothetical protein
MIDVNLTTDEWEEIISSEERSKKSEKQFWFAKRNYIINMLENLDLEQVTEKELLHANLMFLAKIYWEDRKPKNT